ncbi:nucleoside monophosphate kinase [Candidatus Uhrbacteria bacterium]|nr:nucleoside monophosphate kinase [Candidatus Uhrbacteria bacterium]
MKTLVLLGPAGSGKGTQAEKLIEKFHLQKVETGELVREKGKEDSELGRFVHTINISGKHLPDDVVTQLIREAFAKLDASRGLIIDGYPRTLVQAQTLGMLLKEVHRLPLQMVYVRVSDAVARERLLKRAVCSGCKTILASRDLTVCPKCGSKIEVRAYDTDVAAINKRLTWFHEKVMPAIEYYRKKGMVVEVSGESDPDTVFQTIIKAIE